MAGGTDKITPVEYTGWGNNALKYWRTMGGLQGRTTPSDWETNFLKWYDRYAQEAYNTAKTYDLTRNVISNENRSDLENAYNYTQGIYSQLQGIGTPNAVESTTALAKNLYGVGSSNTGVKNTLSNWMTMAEQYLKARPGDETRPEFGGGIRLNSGGNALGNNLRGRAATLNTLREKGNSLDSILRALENKRNATALKISDMQQSANLVNAQKQANLEAQYQQYKIQDINAQAKDSLWDSIIGAGVSAAANTYKNYKTNKQVSDYYNNQYVDSFKFPSLSSIEFDTTTPVY